MNTQAPPAWMDYNSADAQTDFSVIPDNTAVRMALTIRRSQFDPQPGQNHFSPEECAFFSGGYLTYKPETGTVYIDCEFTVTAGQYRNRKVWQLIGVHSPKGPEWGNMGRAMVRAILESARGVSPMDQSPQAQDARRITHVSQLESLEFAAVLTIEKGTPYTDQQTGQQKVGQDRNKIRKVICPDDARWQPIMSGQVGDIPDPTGPSAGGAPAAPWAGQQAPAASVQGSVPPWAAPQPQPVPASVPQTAAPPPAAPVPQPVTHQPPPVTAPAPNTGGGASGPVPAWMTK